MAIIDNIINCKKYRPDGFGNLTHHTSLNTRDKVRVHTWNSRKLTCINLIIMGIKEEIVNAN